MPNFRGDFEPMESVVASMLESLVLCALLESLAMIMSLTLLVKILVELFVV